MRRIQTEKQLWQHIAPKLRGRWTRVEVAVPEGLFDALGLYRNQAWWLELKVGRPAFKVLRPSQQDFMLSLLEHGLPAWSCFWHEGKALFFDGVDFRSPRQPPFYSGV